MELHPAADDAAAPFKIMSNWVKSFYGCSQKLRYCIFLKFWYFDYFHLEYIALYRRKKIRNNFTLISGVLL